MNNIAPKHEDTSKFVETGRAPSDRAPSDRAPSQKTKIPTSMSNEKYQNKYRINSARATWHDYSDGAFFVTVCTKNHKHYFGEIHTVETGRAPSLQMTVIGQFLQENLQNVNNHYPYAEMPSFMIMPNHWHAIVFIDNDKTPYVRRNNTITNEKTKIIDSYKGWLSVVVGGIKSAVTKFAHENRMNFAWQTRFHDHIIRKHNEMNRIVDYIENNPDTWDTDCFNKNNTHRRDGARVKTGRAPSLQMK